MTIALRKLLRRRMQPLLVSLGERLIDLALAEVRRAQGVAIAQLTSALSAAPRRQELDAAPEDQDQRGRAARRARRGGGVPRARVRKPAGGKTDRAIHEEPAVAREVDRADRGPVDEAPAPGPAAGEPGAARRQVACTKCGGLGHNARRHRGEQDVPAPPASIDADRLPASDPPASAAPDPVEEPEPEEEGEVQDHDQDQEEEEMYDRRDPPPASPTSIARGHDRFARLEAEAAARRAKEANRR